MRLVWRLCFLLLSAGLMLAQSPTNTLPDASAVGNEIMVLRRLLAEQQQQITQQREEIGLQHQAIVEQSRQIETLRQQVTDKQNASTKSGNVPPRIVNTSLTNNTPTLAASSQDEKPKESPLSFRIGGAEFTPGGFVDLTAFWRNTNPGTGYGTNFFSIPFHNTIPVSSARRGLPQKTRVSR